MVTDTVSDFIIRIKNASMVHSDQVRIPYSKLRYAVAHKLQQHNFIGNVDKKGEGVKKSLVIDLLYKEDKQKIKDVKRISKPGRRVYFRIKDINKVKNGTGLLILSTPKGILTGEEARKGNVGGEALFSIW